jgi:hypothetical protein
MDSKNPRDFWITGLQKSRGLERLQDFLENSTPKIPRFEPLDSRNPMITESPMLTCTKSRILNTSWEP